MNYRLLTILLVAVILITGCVSKNKETVVIPTQTLTSTIISTTHTIPLCENKCNDICYDITQQECCGSTVHKKQQGFKCCGEDYYDPSVGISCCPKLNGGAKIYIIGVEHCCNGSVGQGGGNWSQCGNSCYNPQQESCCNGTVCAGCCNGKCYSSYNQFCYQGTIYNDTDERACGKHICNEGQKCCNVMGSGGTCYYPDTHECVHAGSQRLSYVTIPA